VYESHYGFIEKPFNLTPDPKYLYLSHRHTEAFAHLEFGRRERGGFILVTGEVGTGKTTLARYFLSRLDAATATAFVLYPALTAAELLRSILEDLHVPVSGTSLKDHVDALHRFLLLARRQGRDVVLLIDEAQDLSAEVLEQIRLLSNLETDTEKLIQIVLMGQNELQEMLARRELRQLAQRVTARYHLTALNRQETEDYIRHRLAVAGGEGKVNFTTGAITAVHRVSQGVPRVINLICDRALLAGYVQGSRVIVVAMVERASEEVQSEPRRRVASRAYAVAGAGVMAAAAIGGVIWLPGVLRVSEAGSSLRAALGYAALELPPGSRPASALPSPVAAVEAAVESTNGSPEAESSPADLLLEPIVLSLDRQGSYGAAIGVVRSLWGGAPVERTILRTHLDQVRRFDLPVVLEMFHPARTDTCFLALLRLEGGVATVSVGSDAPIRVGVGELDRLWTRQAVFLWKDYDAIVGPGRSRRAAAWVRERLAAQGYLGREADLTMGVARFQKDADLTPDGLIGDRTLMTLYTLLGSYPRPRLSGGA